MLTFPQFWATRRAVPLASYCNEFRVDPTDYSGTNIVQCHVFHTGLMVEELPDQKFGTLIERDYIESDLADCAASCYSFYASELRDDIASARDALEKEYGRYCLDNQLECISADELLHNPLLTELQRAWLRNFSARWEANEGRDA